MNIRSFIQKEREQFLKLHKDSRRMLLSFFLYTVADPMINAFINTFLWRQEHDVLMLILYNAGWCIGLPFGFYFNGILLKKYTSIHLYWLGCILQGIVPFIIIFFDVSHRSALLILGMLFGIASGFYWGNRNFLTVRLTESKDRLYFSSLESTLGTLACILVPICIGWLLVFGDTIGIYTHNIAYRVMAFFGMCILIIVGGLTRKIRLKSPKLNNIFLAHVSPSWKRNRIIEILHGIYHGCEMVIPILLILHFLGGEESVGTLQSVTSLIAAGSMYYIGRHVSVHQRMKLLLFAILTAIIGAVFVSIWFSIFGVLVLVTCMSLGTDMRWVALVPFTYDLIDCEKKDMTREGHHYSYLFDREIFLNIGRCIALSICAIVSISHSMYMLRYGLLLGASTQLIMLFMARKLQNKTVCEIDIAVV